MDYRAILRTHGVNTDTLSAGQLTAIVNAMHAAHTAGHVSGYRQGTVTQSLTDALR